MRQNLKIILAQKNPIVGDDEYNKNLFIETINNLKQKKPDIIIFPELFTTGYPPEDLLDIPAFNKHFTQLAHDLAKFINNFYCIYGGIHLNNNKLFNSAYIANKTKIVNIYHKHLLPNYGVFDEKRYFIPGDNISIINVKGHKILITICEDIWFPEEWLNKILKQENPDGIINISASPYHYNKGNEREELFKQICKNNNVWLAYCNLIGGQDELVFDGYSLFIDNTGNTIYRGKQFNEDYGIIEIIEDNFIVENTNHPMEEYEEIYNALLLGLKDYVNKNYFKKVVLGISGGIDSALTAALAVDALGSDNVIGITLPGPYSSEGSVTDSIRLAKNLGFTLHNVNINTIYQEYLKTLHPFFKEKPMDITEENLQARIRGNIVMAFSNKFGYLVLTTGNKSELSTGYCTLYGDMVGGFAVLKDVPKTMVYKLAEYRNTLAGFDIIPKNILIKPPSAELRPDQKDSDSLPDYEILDKIIHYYIEERKSINEIIKLGFDPKTVEFTVKLIQKNEYKRRQGAPGIKITKKAYGKDRRFPITNHWK